MEDALYSAVAARPRSPSARGALGRYLASRARFRIAEVLFQEAMRFGADSAIVRRAIADLAPYRAHPAGRTGAVVRVPFRVSEGDGTLGSFVVGTGAGEMRAVLDPRVSGARSRRGVREFTIGGRRLVTEFAIADSTIPEGEVRIGLDLLWTLHPMVDERAGELTLGRTPDVAAETGRVEQIPFVLTFPGLSLVPRPGVAPRPVQDRDGRVLLRGTRWYVDAAQATLIVVR